MHRMLLQMEWQHLHLWIEALHSPGSKFSYFIFLLKSLMWWWGSPGQQISPARKGKKPVFGKSWGGGLGPGGGGEQQGTDGECSRLPYVIWVASLSWYLGEGDPKIGSERVALLAACFLSSAVGHLEGREMGLQLSYGDSSCPLLCLAIQKSCHFSEQCSWSPLGITLGILL